MDKEAAKEIRYGLESLGNSIMNAAVAIATGCIVAAMIMKLA